MKATPGAGGTVPGTSFSRMACKLVSIAMCADSPSQAVNNHHAGGHAFRCARTPMYDRGQRVNGAGQLDSSASKAVTLVQNAARRRLWQRARLPFPPILKLGETRKGMITRLSHHVMACIRLNRAKRGTFDSEADANRISAKYRRGPVWVYRVPIYESTPWGCHARVGPGEHKRWASSAIVIQAVARRMSAVRRCWAVNWLRSRVSRRRDAEVEPPTSLPPSPPSSPMPTPPQLPLPPPPQPLPMPPPPPPPPPRLTPMPPPLPHHPIKAHALAPVIPEEMHGLGRSPACVDYDGADLPLLPTPRLHSSVQTMYLRRLREHLASCSPLPCESAPPRALGLSSP